MANPIDIISKNSSSSTEVSLVSDKEVTKESPSLFDSLLKDSMGMDKEEETLKQDNTLTKKDAINKETLVVDELNNTEIEDNESINLKNSNNSLLDRLVLEAKKETVKEQNLDKTLNSEILNDTSKNFQNDIVETEVKIPTQNQDINTDSQKVILDESEKINQEAKIETQEENLDKTSNSKISNNDASKNNQINTLDIQEIITSQDNQNVKIDSPKVILNESEENTQTIKISENGNIIKDLSNDSLEITTPIQDNQDVKIDSQKVVLDETIKNTQEIKVEIKDVKISEDESIKNSDKDINIVKPNENKEVLNQNSLQNIESQIISNTSDEEIKTIEPKLNNTDEAVSSIVKEQLVDFEEMQNTNSKKSLMDLLIEKNSKNSILNVLENETINKTELSHSKDFLSSLYLGGQKNILNSQFLLNKSEAINILKNANSLTDIEKSANILELGLEDVNVEQNVDLKTLDLKKQALNNLDKKNLLDSLLMEKSIRSEDVKHLITKSVEASNALLENTLNIAEDVEVSVNSPLSYNIQSRIIGAKQQMSTMMSDIARQMYENYKPPVTVFKINLNPLELGSIAILMKNDKNTNALTISMNASNGGTLEALVENQNVLRNSLNKTFDENTIFNLDFISSNQNNQQSSNGQNNSNQQNRFDRQIDTQSVLQLKEENKDREDKLLDYM